MKQILSILLALLLLILSGCAPAQPSSQILATTLPVYTFTSALCEGTGLSVGQLITENVSCLHDYSLSVRQVKAVESAELVILSGGGLEDFMANTLAGKHSVDCSAGLALLTCHSEHEHDHVHEEDAHFWLSPVHAKAMAQNICAGLKLRYPRHSQIFDQNLAKLQAQLDALLTYGQQTLSSLSCRELITFHDGFAYFAEAFDLTVLEAVEEESGSEASAAELKHLINLTREHQLPAVFAELSGSASAAKVIASETGAKLFYLDMAMSGSSYFDAMYYNINTVKEALG